MFKRLIRGAIACAAIGLAGAGASRLDPSTILQAAAVDAINFLMTLGDRDHLPSSPVQFSAPQGVVYDSAGRLYVSDTEWDGRPPSNRVQAFGTGNQHLYDLVPNEPFLYPVGLAVDANDNLVVADAGNDRIVVFSAGTGSIPPTQIAAFGVHGNFDPLDTVSPDRQWGAPPLSPPTFWYPSGVAVKPGTHLLQAGETTGRLAVVDNGNHRVLVLDSQLTPIYDFGGHSVGGLDTPPGTLEYPWGIAIDGAGQYYVADSENNRVQVFREVVNAQGQRSAQFVRVFGSSFVAGVLPNTFAFGSAPGDMARPYGLNFDSAGRLLVADPDNHRIMRIDVTASLPVPVSLTPCSQAASEPTEKHCFVTTSDGQRYGALVLGAYGWGAGALFNYPQSVAESPSRGLAVADTDNDVIQLFGSGLLSLNFVGAGSVAPGPHAVQQPVTLSVTLKNDGTMPVTATVTPAANLDGMWTGNGTLPIAVGETRIFSFTFSPYEPGALSFQVAAFGTADAMVGGRVNVGTLTLDAGTVTQGIGLTASASASATSGGVGDSFTVTVRLRNTGATRLTNIQAAMAIDNPSLVQQVGPAPAVTTLRGLRYVDLRYTYTMAQTGTVALAWSGSAAYVDPADRLVKTLSATAQPVHLTIKQDATPPVTTISVPTLPASGWYQAPFDVTVSAVDGPAGSGVASITYRIVQENLSRTVAGNTAQFPFSRSGVTEVRYYGTDTAGNVEAGHSLILKLDSVAPDMGTPLVSPALPPSGWYRTNPTITFVAGDSAGGSGLATLTPAVTVTTNGADQTRTGIAQDNAGNLSAEAVATVSVDKIAPELVCVPSRPPNANLTYSADVTMNCSAVDQPGLSGMQSVRALCSATSQAVGVSSAACTYSTQGVNTFLAEATDVAGNLTTTTFQIRVSGPPPVLSCRASGSPTIWPPNHKMVAWNPVVTATSAVSLATFELVAFFSNERDDDHGDGHTSGDMTGWTLNTPDTSGFVRAERSGGRSGRVYTLTYLATDLAGNRAYCSVSASVPHDQGHDDDEDDDQDDKRHDDKTCTDKSHRHGKH